MSSSSLPRALLAASLAAAAATSAANELPKAELFFRQPAIAGAQLSPSGHRLAFSAMGPNGRLGLFVIDTQDEASKPRSAALFSNADVPSFGWADDERLIFSTADLRAAYADDAHAPGLYSVRFDGTQRRNLIERDWEPDERSATTLSANHWVLARPTPSADPAGARPGEIIVGEVHAADREVLRVVPMWLDARTGSTRHLEVHGAPEGAQRWWFDALGLPRAVHTVWRSREALHWLQRPTGGAGASGARWVQLAEAARGQLTLEIEWVGAGETLYVSHPQGPRGETVVAPFDFSKMAPGEALVRTPGFDFHGRLIGDRLGQKLLGLHVVADADKTVWLDPARQRLQQLADATLRERANQIGCQPCEGENAVMLVYSFSDRDPGQWLLWQQAGNAGKGRWRRVGTVQPGIEPARMGRVDVERIPARDGRELPLWITRPAGAPVGQALPTVVMVHGGPWLRSGYWRWSAMAQFLASRGYLVLEPEFRGSAGYGSAHLEAGFKQWGQAMQDDVADALLWARGKGLAGAACIVGGSYGGYSTLMGLIRHPELYRCGSAWVAVTDPFLYLEGSWRVRDDISDAVRRYNLPTMVGDPKADREMLRANSPLEQAARLKAPLQLIWGSEDRRVPIAHGRRLKDALEANGRSPEWVVYEGEGHGVRKPENLVDMANRLERFLRQHLAR